MLRNPEALAIKEISDLFVRAFAKAHFGSAYEAMCFIADFCEDTDVLVLVARAGDAFKGLAIASGQVNVFSPVPFVLYLFSDGGSAVKEAMMDHIHTWVRELGYDRLRCLNTTGRSDEAHMRCFSPDGLGKVVCSMLEYEIPPKAQEV